MKILKYILACAFVGLMFAPVRVSAAINSDIPTILVPHNPTVDYRERTLCFIVDANVSYEVTSTADWATVRKGQNGSVYIHVSPNYYGSDRTASIAFSNAEIGLNQMMNITQTRNESVGSLPEDTRILANSCKASQTEGSNGIEYTNDNNVNTYFESPWSTSSPTKWPLTMTYNFTTGKHIDYIDYVPRQGSGAGNGTPGDLDLYIKHTGESTYTLVGSFNWGKDGGSHSILLPNDIRENVTSIQFKMQNGGQDQICCAEMKFMAENTDLKEELSIFGDDVYSTLRPGVTQADIDNIENPFVKSLAVQLFEGKYDTKYRVAEYECFIPVQTLSDMWKAPGKLYDQRAGVTGINVGKGKHAIVVSGIPEGCSVSLAVTAWWTGKEGGNFDGSGPSTQTYSLRNGLNVIDYENILSYTGIPAAQYDGLAYICYYNDDADNLPNIKVHFVNGEVNGYLSPEKSNAEMKELCKNAKNTCMDVWGKRVHSVWTAKGLYDYCKASDGKANGYRQFINVLDSLITWEHREIGFEKYNRVPRNRTMAYVNYTYYMFQGGFGVSFHHDQESRVLNCQTLMYNDNDAIWGLSHEWGHQHQMTPYLCWGGLGEVSNNIFSYFNVMHMGYLYERSSWDQGRKFFWEKVMPTKSGDNGYEVDLVNGNIVSRRRHDIYTWANSSSSNYSYSKGLRNACLAEKDSVIYNLNDNMSRGLSIWDTGVGDLLAPFILVGNYAKIYLEKDGGKYLDFYPDLFEALRRQENEGGSDIEKKDGIDKYELIAAAQNQNKTVGGQPGYSLLKSTFPNSVWANETTNYNYLNKGNASREDNGLPFALNYVRKCSRLYGYNLFDFFEKWGWFRIGAYRIGDYGNYNYVMTQEMYDEFKADMKALEDDGTLKPLSEEMLHDMFYCRHLNESKTDRLYPTPTIAN